jgi:HEAT repeat protein
MRAPLKTFALLLAAAPLVTACRPADTKNPETWIAKLSESDAKRRVQAVQELRKLKAKVAAAQVAELLKDPQVREDAALALGDLGGPEQVQPLVDAIDTTVGAGSDQAARVANRTNAKIADSLGSIGDARACPPLLRLVRAKDDLVRLSAAQSLGLVHCKEAVSELARIVDDESSPPILIKKAIVSLGLIGDPAAIPSLEHALVLERLGVSFLSESSFALVEIGPPSVDPLLQLLEDKNPAWTAWAKENNRASAGTFAKAAIVLGDLGDQRAVPALLGRLKYTDPDPLPATSRLLTNVVHQFAADALGRLRVKEAAAPIAALVSTRDNSDEDLASFTANALVFIGDRAQARSLLKDGSAGAIRPRLAVLQAAALLGESALKKDLAALAAKERKGQPKDCAREVQEMLNAPVAEEKGACDKIGDAIASYGAPLDAAEACEKDPATCWAQKLSDKEPLVRARAAYELGRLQSPASVGPLLKACADGDLQARLAAIRGLEWVSGAAAAKGALKTGADSLARQLADEQGRVQFVKVNEELKRLQLRLSRL